MTDNLVNILKPFDFSAQEIEDCLSCLTPQFFKKDAYLIQEGTTCDWVAFIDSGIVRNYYHSSAGEEVTYCLTFPHTFITAYSSFILNNKTFENIHALSDVGALVLHKKDYSRLVDSSTAWLKFSRYFAEQSYILMENRLLSMQMESAKERYRQLVENYPEYIAHVPLKFIASYLGVTPRHLSRLRKATAI